MNTRFVYVDDVNKGEVFKRAGRWFWRRGEVAVELFAKGSTLDDVQNGHASAATAMRPKCMNWRFEPWLAIQAASRPPKS